MFRLPLGMNSPTSATPRSNLSSWRRSIRQGRKSINHHARNDNGDAVNSWRTRSLQAASTCPRGRWPPLVPSRNPPAAIVRRKLTAGIVSDQQMPPCRFRVNIAVESSEVAPARAQRPAPLERKPHGVHGRTPPAWAAPDHSVVSSVSVATRWRCVNAALLRRRFRSFCLTASSPPMVARCTSTGGPATCRHDGRSLLGGFKKPVVIGFLASA